MLGIVIWSLVSAMRLEVKFLFVRGKSYGKSLWQWCPGDNQFPHYGNRRSGRRFKSHAYNVAYELCEVLRKEDPKYAGVAGDYWIANESRFY